MLCLYLASLVFVCNFSALVAANFANVVRNVNLNAGGNFGGALKPHQDHEALIAQKFNLPARGLPVESTVTVTVTTTPEYCSALTSPVPGVPGTPLVTQTTSVPAGSATPSPETPVTPYPTGGLIPYPVASLSSGSPVLPASALPTPIIGANTTVTTSSLSATKSVGSSEVLSLTSSTAPSSAPATSSTSAPTGGVAKDSNMNGLLLTIVLALSGCAVLLL